MMFPRRLTLHRAPVVRDRHRNPRRDWTRAELIQLPRCSVQPGAPPPEYTAGRDTTGTAWTVYALAAPRIDPTDRIEIDGGLHDIIGDPAVWPAGVALPPMTVILCRRWEEHHG